MLSRHNRLWNIRYGCEQRKTDYEVEVGIGRGIAHWEDKDRVIVTVYIQYKKHSKISYHHLLTKK